jgi:hypothetical protein
MVDLDTETPNERRRRLAALRMKKLRENKAAAGMVIKTVTIPAAREAELAAIVAAWMAGYSPG